MPKPEEQRAAPSVESTRLRSIRQRLQENFYAEAPASERIAVAVLVDLKNLDESSPALPH